MPRSEILSTRKTNAGRQSPDLHFDVSTGLKSVLGQELITDDEVAIFEMVKNSYDAKAKVVHLYFAEDSITVADNGIGMSFDDLKTKWLFVAYSAKKKGEGEKDFRQAAADRGYYAGSKGIGRFSSDRIGRELTLQTRPKTPKFKGVHKLSIDWARFEKDDQEHFEDVPVDYSEEAQFVLPGTLKDFKASLSHGTVIELSGLRQKWDRDALRSLKSSLAKLINPFGAEVDGFSIYIHAPAQVEEDRKKTKEAKRTGEGPASRDVINGRVGNFIFSALQEKTTFINVAIRNGLIESTLTDRGEVIYSIEEPNPYKRLDQSGFHCEIYYLNHSAKLTFAKRVGLPSVQFGSVFLFRNNFRVYPIGEDGDDWFGFNRRKQQGYARHLGSREVIGRVDVFGSDSDFQEASSRNQGLIENVAVRQLQKCVMDHCLKRLEKYVVPVSWVDKADGETDDLSRLLTDPGKARVSAAIADLVDNADITLHQYSKRLVGLLNERSSEFEASLVSVRTIAEKVGDKNLLSKLSQAEKRFDQLKKSEVEARKVADHERTIAQAATARAVMAETDAADARYQAETDRRRALFLESVVNLDTATILNLHHQITIYAVDIAQQIENFLATTTGEKMVPRENVLNALEQMAFLNRKVLAVTRFAPRATFKLDSERIEADLPVFIQGYIDTIARASHSARTRIVVDNAHPGMKLRFNPMDISIVVDNLISNAKKAKASKITFTITQPDKQSLHMRVADNGQGISQKIDTKRIFEMGYTTTRGSGLGLYHVKQVLGELNGSIELDESDTAGGTAFLVRIVSRKL